MDFVRTYLERDVRALMREKPVVDHFAALATETVASSAAEFTAYIAGERAKWGKLVREAKIRGE